MHVENLTADAPQSFAACAGAMYRALAMLPCRCCHNVLYAGCKVEQEITQKCARCASMAQYEALVLAQVA